jgi:hypothetical protein
MHRICAQAVQGIIPDLPGFAGHGPCSEQMTAMQIIKRIMFYDLPVLGRLVSRARKHFSCSIF